jgi:hypothetical protein
MKKRMNYTVNQRQCVGQSTEKVSLSRVAVSVVMF